MSEGVKDLMELTQETFVVKSLELEAYVMVSKGNNALRHVAHLLIQVSKGVFLCKAAAKKETTMD
jgi:hypothetical protein